MKPITIHIVKTSDLPPYLRAEMRDSCRGEEFVACSVDPARPNVIDIHDLKGAPLEVILRCLSHETLHSVLFAMGEDDASLALDRLRDGVEDRLAPSGLHTRQRARRKR
jgi:hypothetical protein